MQAKRLIISAVLLSLFGYAAADGFPDDSPYKPAPTSKTRGAKKDDPVTARSRAALKVVPYQHSDRNTGTQVWQITDGEAEFLEPVAAAPRREPPPVEVAIVAPAATMPSVTGATPYPQSTPRPSVVPETDAFGYPAPDKAIAATIPANAEDVPTLDPDRFNLTPISLYAEAATLDEIMTRLVPRAYRISYDVKPEKRSKTYKIIVEDNLKQAFKDLGDRLGIDIVTYHKAQVVLVTDRKDQ